MRRSVWAFALAGGLVVSSSVVAAAPSGGALPAPLVLEVFVAGDFGVPIDAVAVALNVTAASPLAAGFVSVYPCSGAVPDVSNLNYAAGQDVPNSALVRLSDDGSVCVSTSATTDVIVDLNGYVPAGSSLTLLDAPTRALDTRNGTGAARGRVAADGVVVLDVRSVVPVGLTTVVLNVTAVGPDATGFATAYPCDQPRPSTSTLNYRAGHDVPNLAVSRVAVDGTVCIHTSAGADLLADITGYVEAAGSGVVTLASPARVADTRSGLGGPALPVGSDPRPVQIHGVVGVPTTASMVLANVTSTRAAAAGFATVFPCGVAVPEVSNLNFVPGVDVANAALLKIGAGGTICATASVPTDLIVDVVGYVEGTTDLVALDPQRIYDTRNDAVPECNLAISPPTGNSVTATDLRTVTSRTYSWPTLASLGSSLSMSILPTCDGFVTLIPKPPGPPIQFTHDIWEFKFDGTSRPISDPALQYYGGTIVHVTSGGEVLVLAGGTVATPEGELIARAPVHQGFSPDPLGVLFDELFVFAYRPTIPSFGPTLIVTLGPDPVGVIMTEEIPPGSRTPGPLVQGSMYSPSGNYMLTSMTRVEPPPLSIVATRAVISIGPSILATPPIEAPGLTFARWLAEGELVVCHNSQTYRWSMFSTTMTLLPGVECPNAVR